MQKCSLENKKFHYCGQTGNAHLNAVNILSPMSLHLLSKRGKLDKTLTDSEKFTLTSVMLLSLRREKDTLSSQVNDSQRVKTGHQRLD